MDKISHCCPFLHLRLRTQQFVVTLSVLATALSWITTSHAHNDCSLTRYPNLCAQTLMEFGSSNQTVDHNILVLLHKSILETNLPSSYFSEFKTNAEDVAHSVIAGNSYLFIYFHLTKQFIFYEFQINLMSYVHL